MPKNAVKHSVTKFEKPIPSSVKKIGWTANPNTLYSELIPRRCFSGETELLLTLTVMRLTLGEPDKPEYARGLTAADYAERIGEKDAKNVERSLKRLCAAGILERAKEGRGLAYRAMWENWEHVLTYVPEPVKPKVPAPEPVVQVVPPERPLILKPGKQSRPMTLPPAERNEFTWRNEVPGIKALRMDVSIVAGRWEFVTRVPKKGEEKANHLGHTGPVSQPFIVSNQHLTGSDFAENVRELINGFSFPALGKTLPAHSPLLADIVFELQGADIEHFRQVITPAKRRIKTMGFFALLARDTGQAHVEEHTKRKAQAEAYQRQSDIDHERRLDEHRREWPNYTAEDRKWLKELWTEFAEMED